MAIKMFLHFLCFRKVWKANIRFLKSVRPSARPSATSKERLPLGGFSLTFRGFIEICRENLILVGIGEKMVILREDLCTEYR
jgi:hypothetical protein